MRNMRLDGRFRLAMRMQVTTGGLNAMKGPRFSLWVWSAFGEKELWRGERRLIFQLLVVVFLYIYLILQSKVPESHPFCNKLYLSSCVKTAQIQVFLRFPIICEFLIASLVILITY